MSLKPLYLLIIVSGLLNSSIAASVTDEQWIAMKPKPWQLTEQQLDEVLPLFKQRFPDFQERLRALALWRVGTPYEIFKLGEEQAPDTDPVFRLDVSDCTGHILTSLSLALSESWSEARKNMINIHYKPDAKGKKTPTYKSRWHYTSDRIMNHPATPDITATLVDDSQLVVQNISLNRKKDGNEFLKLDWTLDTEVKYIPNAQITPELLRKLPEIAGVVFVKPDYFSMGIVSGHEGMIIDGTQLLHAGQVAGETVIEDFMKYYFTDNGPRFGGIMLFEFKPL